MDIIDFTLKDYKLYSPSTGELIYDARKSFLNEEAKSLAGCWDFDSGNYHDYYECRFDSATEQMFDVFRGITINHTDLSRAWQNYLIEFPRPAVDLDEKKKVDLENFIWDYDNQSNLICFRITHPEKPWERMYFVIEMNGTPKLLE